MSQRIEHREYRSLGRFSAADMRNLAPGPGDAIAIGCPRELFLRVLEKRAAFRATRPVAAAERAAMKRRYDESLKRASAQDREAAKLPSGVAADHERDATQELIRFMKKGAF